MATNLDDLYSIYKDTKDTLHQDNLSIEDAIRSGFPRQQGSSRQKTAPGGPERGVGGNLPQQLQQFNRMMNRIAPGMQRLTRSSTQMRRFMRDVGAISTGRGVARKVSGSFTKQAAGEAVGSGVAHKFFIKNAVKEGVREGMSGSVRSQFLSKLGRGVDTSARSGIPIGFGGSKTPPQEKRRRPHRWEGLTRKAVAKFRAKKMKWKQFMDPGDVVKATAVDEITPGLVGGWNEEKRMFSGRFVGLPEKMSRAKRIFGSGKKGFQAFKAARLGGAGMGGALKGAMAAGKMSAAAGATGIGGAAAGGAGGAMGAAGGGMAAAGAALASNPIGWAVAIAGAVVAIGAMPFVIAKFNDALLNSQKHLANFSGGMAAVFARQDVRETMRNIRSSHARAGIASFQQQESDQFWDNMQPLFDLVYNIFGFISGAFMWIINSIFEVIKWGFTVTLEALELLVKYASFGLVSLKEILAELKPDETADSNLANMLKIFEKGRADELQAPGFKFVGQGKKKK